MYVISVHTYNRLYQTEKKKENCNYLLKIQVQELYLLLFVSGSSGSIHLSRDKSFKRWKITQQFKEIKLIYNAKSLSCERVQNIA